MTISYSDQYKSAIFYHDDEQKKLAEETRDALEESTGRTVYTEIVPAGPFYIAEDYHQKYYLKNLSDIVRDLVKIYPNMNDFTNSTAVARLNGYAGGYGTAEEFKEELESLGLSEKGKESIRKIVDRGLSPACPILTPSS